MFYSRYCLCSNSSNPQFLNHQRQLKLVKRLVEQGTPGKSGWHGYVIYVLLVLLNATISMTKFCSYVTFLQYYEKTCRSETVQPRLGLEPCSFFLKFNLIYFLYSRFLLVIYFIHISVYMSIPISQFIPPPPPHHHFPPLVSIRLFSTSVSLFLPCKPVHLYHFSRFHIYALYDILNPCSFN